MPFFYRVGTGIGDVTDLAVGLLLQGMADQRRKSTGVESHLYAQAFVEEKFVQLSDRGEERPVGMLSSYLIHPTDRGQSNTLVCGDNKGYASWLFERKMGSDYGGRRPLVAAFANANCGDVSGNVELGHIPDGVGDRGRMQKHGRQQFELAERLFETATEEVAVPVDYRHTRVDFSNVEVGADGDRTWPAALGVSFAAGSSEDSVPVPNMGVHEGISAPTITHAESLITDAMRPALTAMAGRRLRKTVLEVLAGIGVTDVALGKYANEYSPYITTPEEYGAQHYEGASTLFGPHTLAAYQQVAAQLARAIAQGKRSPPGPAPTPWTARPHRRYRFRKLSDAAVHLRFYNCSDQKQWVTLPNGRKTLAAHTEVAYPEREFTGHLLPTIRTVKISIARHRELIMAAGELLTVSADGSISVGSYSPPTPVLKIVGHLSAGSPSDAR